MLAPTSQIRNNPKKETTPKKLWNKRLTTPLPVTNIAAGRKMQTSI